MAYNHKMLRLFNEKNMYNEKIPKEELFLEYFESDEAKKLSFDVNAVKNNNDIFFNITNFKYVSDDTKVFAIDVITSDPLCNIFTYTIYGYYKEKPFSITIKSKELECMIFSGKENKYNKNGKKPRGEATQDRKYTTKLPRGMKTYIYETFSFRNAMLVVSNVCYGIAKEMRN